MKDLLIPQPSCYKDQRSCYCKGQAHQKLLSVHDGFLPNCPYNHFGFSAEMVKYPIFQIVIDAKMEDVYVKVGKGRRITLPPELAVELNVKEGDILLFRKVNNTIIVMKVEIPK